MICARCGENNEDNEVAELMKIIEGLVANIDPKLLEESDEQGCDCSVCQYEDALFMEAIRGE